MNWLNLIEYEMRYKTTKEEIKKTNLKNNKDIQSNNKVITTHPELILTTSHSIK